MAEEAEEVFEEPEGSNANGIAFSGVAPKPTLGLGGGASSILGEVAKYQKSGRRTVSFATQLGLGGGASSILGEVAKYQKSGRRTVSFATQLG
ncbi:hypothetical protein ACIQMV_13385, partial [Streptomyces sp. NPDC091412]|uniref:hypothetical protein n=1 Tax=Streptomyces sp. NPDC091412 TaxID=3366002 RepID=UPI0037F9FA38